jgi:hypothetical protein
VVERQGELVWIPSRGEILRAPGLARRFSDLRVPLTFGIPGLGSGQGWLRPGELFRCGPGQGEKVRWACHARYTVEQVLVCQQSSTSRAW